MEQLPEQQPVQRIDGIKFNIGQMPDEELTSIYLHQIDRAERLDRDINKIEHEIAKRLVAQFDPREDGIQ